jgi:hypothetical protein
MGPFDKVVFDQGTVFVGDTPIATLKNDEYILKDGSAWSELSIQATS